MSKYSCSDVCIFNIEKISPEMSQVYLKGSTFYRQDNSVLIQDVSILGCIRPITFVYPLALLVVKTGYLGV